MTKSDIHYNQKHIYNYLDQHLTILQQDVASFSSCNLRDLSWKNYQYYSQDCLGIVFQEMKFPEYLSKRMSGTLIVTPRNKKIVTNTGMSSSRQHFTKMHELVHFWEHAKNKSKLVNYNFMDMVDKGSYDISIQNDLREIEANIGAGILMVNSWQLHEMIVNNYSWSTALSIFEISNSAFYYRVKQFLENELSIPTKQSSGLTINGRKYGLGYLQKYCNDWYSEKLSKSSQKTQDLIYIEANNPHWSDYQEPFEE